jgi:hypothetical protein
MSEKIAKYRLPNKEEDLDILADNVFTYAEPRIARGDVGWTDIPAAAWAAFKVALAVWKPIYAVCKKPHLPTDTKAKNKAETALRKALSELLRRGFLLDPRTTVDAVSMGFRLLAGSRSVMKVVIDLVEIDSITNSPATDSHIHIMRFCVKGRRNRAKAPYRRAVFQAYIQGPGDPPPFINGVTGWGKEYGCQKEPFVMQHDASDAGTMAYYRACWETTSGVRGPWTMRSARVS